METDLEESLDRARFAECEYKLIGVNVFQRLTRYVISTAHIPHTDTYIHHQGGWGLTMTAVNHDSHRQWPRRPQICILKDGMTVNSPWIWRFLKSMPLVFTFSLLWPSWLWPWGDWKCESLKCGTKKNAGLENAGMENVTQKCRTWKCRKGKYGTRNLWLENARQVSMESEQTLYM